jgi:hypothetical protein
MTKLVGLVRASTVLFATLIGICAAANAPAVELDGGPLVMRRLTEDQYRNTINDIFGALTIGGRFEPDTREGHLIAVGASKATVTPSGLEEYDRMATSIAQQVVDPKRRNQYIPCKPADPSAPDDACARTFLTKVGHLLYRRPMTDQEISDALKIASTGATQVKQFYFGVQLALTAMLESPQFLFVKEEAEADPNQTGAYRLNPQSMATRLSLLLWGSSPDVELLRAATAGELDTSDGLARQVDRMIASPRFEAGVRTYFADMLTFDQFAALSKDPTLYPNYSAEVAKQAQEQALRTIVDLLVAHDGDYRDIYTTDRTYLTPLLASAYGVPFTAKWGDLRYWAPVELPKNMPSAGVLTQIGFAALHSSSGKTSPTLRGKALRELVLCQDIPPPPPNVDFSKFATADANVISVREAIEAHSSNPACAGCHKLMDPLGLALEHYDTSGVFRTEDAHKPVDASGFLDKATYQDAAGLGKAIHDSPRTTSCLVNRVFTYATGRAETANEKEWVKDALLADWAAQGYTFPALLRRITLDSGFYRVAIAQKVASEAKSTTAE